MRWCEQFAKSWLLVILYGMYICCMASTFCQWWPLAVIGLISHLAPTQLEFGLKNLCISQLVLPQYKKIGQFWKNLSNGWMWIAELACPNINTVKAHQQESGWKWHLMLYVVKYFSTLTRSFIFNLRSILRVWDKTFSFH